MKVFVTGATGFIGGNLTRELLRQGYQVRALVRKGTDRKAIAGLNVELAEGDLLDAKSLEDALSGCEALFHVAALYGFWAANPRLFYDTNVRGTENIMRAARKNNIKKIVYTSSESVVGVAKHSIGDESGRGCLDQIPSDYKKSKFLAEEAAAKMCSDGLPVVIVNPTTPIGAYDVKPTPTGQIVLDFLKGKMFAFVNTGLNVIDVEDVARGHILALEKGKVGERYLLGNKNLTLQEIFLILEKLTGIKAPGVKIPLAVALAAGYCDDFIEGTIMRRNPTSPFPR